MFGEEARFLGEFLVGRTQGDQTPASYAVRHNKNLESAFASARENLGKAQSSKNRTGYQAREFE